MFNFGSFRERKPHKVTIFSRNFFMTMLYVSILPILDVYVKFWDLPLNDKKVCFQQGAKLLKQMNIQLTSNSDVLLVQP